MMQLTPEEHAYIVQLLQSRPISEALPLFLKLTGQVLARAPEMDGEAQPARPTLVQ